jgi:hypothetical protein
MFRDPDAHLIIKTLGSRDIDPGRRMPDNKFFGMTTLARPRAAKNERYMRGAGYGAGTCQCWKSPLKHFGLTGNVRLSRPACHDRAWPGHPRLAVVSFKVGHRVKPVMTQGEDRSPDAFSVTT